jgi:hypothetical protein
MDLANATFVHRFLSPAWYEALKKHLAGANRQNFGDTDTLFDTIVALQTGEALLFCPTAQINLNDSLDGHKDIQALGNGFVKLKIRKRLTTDGGRSIMATDRTNVATAQTDIPSVPMHIVQPKPKSSAKINGNGVAYKAPTIDVSSDLSDGISRAGYWTPATSVSNINCPAATPTGNQVGAGAKLQGVVSTSIISRDDGGKTDKPQESSKVVSSKSNGKPSASKVQPISKTSTTLTASPATLGTATTPKAPAESTASVATKTLLALEELTASQTSVAPKTLPTSTTPAAPKISTAATAGSTAPSNGNINPTRQQPNESIKKQLSAEAERQARVIFQTHRYDSTSRLSSAQRNKLYSDVEASLQLPSNTLAKDGPWRIFFYERLNKQLVSPPLFGPCQMHLTFHLAGGTKEAS